MKNGKELNKSLREMTISCGLCQQWQGEWKQDWNLDKMVSQFYRGIDFFISKRFMPNGFIKGNFDRDFLRENGVLVDDEYSLLCPRNAILIGKSKSNIRFNAYNTGTLYILDESVAKVTAKGGAFVMVHVYGKAQLEAEQTDKARIVVVNHSEESIIIAADNVKVREEEGKN